MLQREAVRTWLRDGWADELGEKWENSIRKTFPLPLVRVPNVVNVDGWTCRLNSVGALEHQSKVDGQWRPSRSAEYVKAIAELAAHPWVEQPAPEEE